MAWVSDHLRILFCLRLSFLVLSLAFHSIAFAWPVVIDPTDMPSLLGTLRTHLLAFSFSEDGNYKIIPLEIDERNSKGDRVFRRPTYETSERKEFYKSQRSPSLFLEDSDEIVLDDRDFAVCGKACDKARETALRACGGTTRDASLREMVRVDLAFLRSAAFVVDCGKPVFERTRRLIKTDLGNRTFETPWYRYVFSAANSMLFDEFALRTADGNLEKVLGPSALDLYAKPKAFFPLHFTGEDVVSNLVSFTESPLSTTGELSFVLKVLLFRIRLNLLSQVSLYEDAIRVPLVLNIPVSGNLLRQGSGFFYGFKAGKEIMRSIETDLPFLTQFGEKIPFAPYRTFALHHKGALVVAAVHMPASFAAMQFAPALTSGSQLRALGFSDAAEDLGVFFDITRLQKGEHRMSVWFYIGREEDGARLRLYAKDGIRYKISAIP